MKEAGISWPVSKIILEAISINLIQTRNEKAGKECSDLTLTEFSPM
jgi:hypothetical protein